jgi:hypothetical protein
MAKAICRKSAALSIRERRAPPLVGLGIDAPGDRKGLGARLQGAVMRAFFGPAMKDKQRGVDAVMASGLEWTIVRAPLIEDGPSLGRVEADPRSVPRGSVRAADLADFILDAAIDGPTSAPRHSWPAAARCRPTRRNSAILAGGSGSAALAREEFAPLKFPARG